MKSIITVSILLSVLSTALLAPVAVAQTGFAPTDFSQTDFPQTEKAQAKTTRYNDVVLLLAQGKKKLTEAEAAKRAREQYGGKVLGVTCREQDDRIYCSVRLDIDGRIKTVTIRG